MIDFWELAGRLILMDPAARSTDFYSPTGLMPLQSDGCILLGHATTTTLPFSPANYYNPLRNYFTGKYTGINALQSPVISMFALGEIGVMLFNQPFRDALEDLSTYLRNTSNISGRSDTGSGSVFYMVLALLVVDSTTRASVAGGNFLGLAPTAAADRTALQTLAADPTFITKANVLCFTQTWTEGSANTLRDQGYPAGGAALPFRHFRFTPGLS